MIMPVVFSLTPLLREYYGHVFLKGVCLARHHGWPVFVQQEVADLDAYPAEHQAMLYSPEYAENNEHEPFKKHFLNQCRIEVFPQEIVDRFISSYPSLTDSQMASQANPWPEMEEYLVACVRQLEEQLGEKAEAFMMQTAPQFVRDAATRLGIVVIDYEWGAFRKPFYRTVARIDLKGTLGNGELVERFEMFRNVSPNVPLFKKREILALFLRTEHLSFAEMKDEEPVYEAGVALGYNIPHVYSGFNQCSAIEMVTAAKRHFGNSNICARYHPGDPLHAQLYGIKEERGTLIEFIQKCKRIVCCASNIAYEAMLYNRPAYELGWSQMAHFANATLENVNDYIAGDDFLSFMAFGYYAPIELLNNVEYLRWRLSRPGEDEVYRYHLEYMLNCLNLEKELLGLPENERLTAILKGRDYLRQGQEDVLQTPVWAKTNEQARQTILIERLNSAKNSLERRLSDKQAELEAAQLQVCQQDEQLQKQNVQIEQMYQQLEQCNAYLSTRTYRWSRKVVSYINQAIGREKP